MKSVVCFCCAFVPLVLFSQTANLTIRVKDVERLEGSLQIGVYRLPENFPKVGREYRVAHFKVQAATMVCEIADLPLGTYAIAVYHDRNSDGKLNMNWLGIPKEPYGFSNNVKPVFKAPSFKSTAITLGGDAGITIALIKHSL